MSMWTYVTGVIEVSVPGRSQPECDYILQSVLCHLPRVTGSEGDMSVFVNRHKGDNTSSSADEYGMQTNNLTDYRGYKTSNGWLRFQDTYSLTLQGSLRDRYFDEAFREFMKWLIRLSKRVAIHSAFVRLKDYNKSYCISDDRYNFDDMYEVPSWSISNKEHEPAWWEHLMWDAYPGTPLPISLLYKYYSDEEVDKEFERRFKKEDK